MSEEFVRLLTAREPFWIDSHREADAQYVELIEGKYARSEHVTAEQRRQYETAVARLDREV